MRLVLLAAARLLALGAGGKQSGFTALAVIGSGIHSSTAGLAAAPTDVSRDLVLGVRAQGDYYYRL